MYGDLVRDSLSLCASTLRVVLGSSRGWNGRSSVESGDRLRPSSSLRGPEYQIHVAIGAIGRAEGLAAAFCAA